jgi:cell division transport system ATP-binding protein
MIQFDRVSKRYPNGKDALSKVSFSLPAGQLTFLTGHSGAGKSTLLKLIMMLERPTQGQVLLDNQNLNGFGNRQIPLLRRKIGMVHQNHQLLFDRTVFDNVALSLEVLGFKRSQLEKRVKQVIEGVGLGDKIYRKAIQLSGGEQQRVAIARAVVNRPPIILADEPTGNLDRQRTLEVVALMNDLNARGATILFATHDETIIKVTHRRVFRLNNGRLERS